MSLRMIPITQLEIVSDAREDLGDMKTLIESIKTKGLLQPITVSNESSNDDLEPVYYVRAGRRRFRACQEAGLIEIPCLIRQVVDDLDADEIELIENTHRKDLEWHEEVKLRKRIHDMYIARHGGDWSLDKTATLLEKAVGTIHGDLELAELVDHVPEFKKVSKKDALKAIKKAKNQITTKELVAEHKKTAAKHDPLLIADANYRVGDALEALDDYIEYLASHSNPSMVKLIEVDPPYGIDLHKIKKGNGNVFNVSKEYKEVDPAEYVAWLNSLCTKLYAVAAPDAWVIFWYGIEWHHHVQSALAASGFAVDKIPCIWSKGVGQTNTPDTYLARTWEPFFVARKGNPKLRKQGRANVFDFPPVPAAHKIHPTQRPVALMREILSTFAWPNSVVLVPFLGSGSTLRAVYREDMSGWGYDLSEKHKQDFLGQVARDQTGDGSE